MKKILAALLVILTLTTAVVLTGCGGTKLSGNAERIDFTDGWSIRDASFEYINDNAVKIVRKEDGQVFYVPTSSIDMIWMPKEN